MDNNRPKPVELTLQEVERLYGVPEDDPELGMNMVSNDYTIVMVNRANERLYGKPMVELLGKKCYEEFERRSEVCSHCPGSAALATGRPHMVETEGIRDDGTRFSIQIIAYPVLGPGGATIGFIEVEQETTEKKRGEQVTLSLSNFRSAVARADNMQRAVRQALDASLALDSIDSGCALIVDESGEERIVVKRGFPETCLDEVHKDLRRNNRPGAKMSLLDVVVGRPRTAGTLKAFAAVPIFCDERLAAELVLGSSTHEEIPPSTRAALASIAVLLGSGLERIKSGLSRRETAAQVKAVLGSLPTAVWCMDAENRVTLWNTASERLFGRGAAEVVGQPPAFLIDASEGQISLLQKPHRAIGYAGGVEFGYAARNGVPLRIWAYSLPFHGIIDDSSEIIIVAQSLDHRE